MKLKDLLERCEAGVFVDPDDLVDGSGSDLVTAMVYLPQRAGESLDEIADGFEIQYGTLHGWGEYEISLWALANRVGSAEWRQFVDVVERSGGTIELDEGVLQ